ncbi:protein NLRC3-like [Neolamprologus brichardi]|uniref:protein NLRC3-like n=1 Tax=Neolamprologus brichardi TaxID=32507 RepID=UPI001643E32F|nr:protein NLRC3-like [Neolamprologus brichardi]
MLVEDNIISFVRKQLKELQEVLHADFPEYLESQSKDEEMLEAEVKEQRENSREAFVKITLHFLRKIKQEELADSLQNKIFARRYQYELKSHLKKKFGCVFEGIAKTGNPTLLNQIYTELYITEGGTGNVNAKHEIRQIETASRKLHKKETTIRQEDIFKVPPGRDKPIRTVLTKGVAGIGKTVLTQKFTLDWAEKKANQNFQFIFPFAFRELNVLKEKRFSLVDLVNLFFSEIREVRICNFEDFQVLFIFDGLDECRLPLDFHNTELIYIYIHLSVQEFLAALHVHLTFINTGVNLLEEQQNTSRNFETRQHTGSQFYESAVKKALQSPNGLLDLFLRFLLGLSLQSNQTLLQGLLTQTGNGSQINQETLYLLD